MSSSTAIVKILCHTITLFVTPVRKKKRIALTFVKPRGGEGQNGRLKCPMGFLVFVNLPYREEYLSMIEHTADGHVDADLIFRALTMVRRSKNLLHL